MIPYRRICGLALHLTSYGRAELLGTVYRRPL